MVCAAVSVSVSVGATVSFSSILSTAAVAAEVALAAAAAVAAVAASGCAKQLTVDMRATGRGATALKKERKRGGGKLAKELGRTHKPVHTHKITHTHTHTHTHTKTHRHTYLMSRLYTPLSADGLIHTCLAASPKGD